MRLLSTGTDALQARIALARAATKTLDMQYYLANEDNSRKLLLGAALYAADRDVRVRMLVDDLNFKDIDRIMAALNTHQNIEICVFNPFGSTQRGFSERTQNIFSNVDHSTRRMHNKAMIADNPDRPIGGGRNLGDEYFSASPTLQFRDLDVFAASPVTQKISASFDEYWNSSISYPLRVLNKQKFDAGELDKQDSRRPARAQARPGRSAERQAAQRNAARAADFARGTQPDVSADQILGRFAIEDFESARRLQKPADGSLSRAYQDAQHEFLILSPYFVPHDKGVQAPGDLTKRDVCVAVLTNSLAATDAIAVAVAVQAGYAPYRIPLLREGVELYEFKPMQTQGEGRPTAPACSVRNRTRACMPRRM